MPGFPVSVAKQEFEPEAEADREPEHDEAPESGYDRIADGYARHWGPVIRPAAEQVLDVIAPAVAAALAAGPEPRMLDVGTGTGTLAIAALERWPALRVTGVDPSGGMLELARVAAGERISQHGARYRTEIAYADELPFGAASFDLAVSSFVLQLVPSRAAALREFTACSPRAGRSVGGLAAQPTAVRAGSSRERRPGRGGLRPTRVRRSLRRHRLSRGGRPGHAASGLP